MSMGHTNAKVGRFAQKHTATPPKTPTDTHTHRNAQKTEARETNKQTYQPTRLQNYTTERIQPKALTFSRHFARGTSVPKKREPCEHTRQLHIRLPPRIIDECVWM